MNDEEFGAWAKKIRVTYSPEEASRIIEAGPERDVNGLANTIREALNVGPLPPTTWGKEQLDEAHDALDALVAQTQKHGWAHAHEQTLRAEAAEERASQLEHERDKLARDNEWLAQQRAEVRGSAQRWQDECRAILDTATGFEQERNEARREADQLRALAQAVVDKYTEGLGDPSREWVAWNNQDGNDWPELRALAAALAGVQAKEPPKPTLPLFDSGGKLGRYAEESKTWTHGQKTEDELLQRIWNLAGDVTKLVAALGRAAYVAQHLHEMVDRETWRAHGVEHMGQYEGDYHAEKVAEEIKSWASLAGEEQT